MPIVGFRNSKYTPTRISFKSILFPEFRQFYRLLDNMMNTCIITRLEGNLSYPWFLVPFNTQELVTDQSILVTFISSRLETLPRDML